MYYVMQSMTRTSQQVRRGVLEFEFKPSPYIPSRVHYSRYKLYGYSHQKPCVRYFMNKL